jgi:hypothetical protein
MYVSQSCTCTFSCLHSYSRGDRRVNDSVSVIISSVLAQKILSILLRERDADLVSMELVVVQGDEGVYGILQGMHTDICHSAPRFEKLHYRRSRGLNKHTCKETAQTKQTRPQITKEAAKSHATKSARRERKKKDIIGSKNRDGSRKKDRPERMKLIREIKK